MGELLHCDSGIDGLVIRHTYDVRERETPLVSGPVVQVLLGKITPEQVVLPEHNEKWQTERDRCELEFYLGELDLFHGNMAQ